MALLTSFTDMAQLLDLNQASLDDYPQLSFVMTSVDDAIQTYLKRTLEQDAYTETKFMYGDSKMLALKAIPIVSVSAVVVDNVTIDPSWVTITPYGLLFGYAVAGFVTVEYTGGIDEIPGGLKRAASLQAAYEYQNIDHVGAETVSNEGGSIQRPALGLLREVKRMLNEHVHPMGAFL